MTSQRSPFGIGAAPVQWTFKAAAAVSKRGTACPMHGDQTHSMKRKQEADDAQGAEKTFLRVLIANELGSVKVTEADTEDLSSLRVSATWGTPTKKQRIASISAEVPQSSLHAEAGLFALLRADGGLELRHASSGDVYATAEVQTNTGLASKDGHIAQLSRNQSLASRLPALLHCQSDGTVVVYAEPETIEEGVAPAWKEVKRWMGPKNVQAMAVDEEEEHVAFACDGSEPSLWSLESGKQVYLAKGAKPDRTGLMDKANNTCVCFIPSSQFTRILVGTDKHKLKLYDIAQRRPKLVVEFGEARITALAPETSGDKVWVADTRGKIGCLDLKAGAMHRKLQGFAGSIRALQLHPTRPIIASSGLDRFLYLHNTITGKPLARCYMKQATVGLCFCPDLLRKEEPKTRDTQLDVDGTAGTPVEENVLISDSVLPALPTKTDTSEVVKSQKRKASSKSGRQKVKQKK